MESPGLEFSPEPSGENRSELVASPYVAAIAPSGACSAPAAAGSEAAEAERRSIPVLSAERPGAYFFPQPSVQKRPGFHTGQYAQILGLRARPELTGMVGRLLEFAKGSGRWRLLLDNREYIRIKPESMMLWEGPQESSIAGATQYFDIAATNGNNDNDNDNSNNNNAGNNNNNNNANSNDIATTNNKNDNDGSIEVMPGDAKSTPDQDARGQRRFDELQALQIIKNQQKLQGWEETLRNDPGCPLYWKPKPGKPPSVYALTQLERRIDEYERLHPNAARRWRHGRLEDGDLATAGCEQFDMGRCPKGPFCELIITFNSKGRQPMPPALWPSTLSPPPK
ncbi:unnamed protein product [Polarella glacialis]|uniref:Uncharacterized protein n=1 Tax=Polarella glacialis TaxID=89957 RepID=A0A813GKT4_POLGL|nr:unnamed protein product [Polarella glacialis]